MNIHADVNYTVHQIHVQFVSSVLVLDSVPIDLKVCYLVSELIYGINHENISRPSQ